MMPPNLIERPAVCILAGGQGTRVQRILGDLPKPLAFARGRPFMDWLIGYLSAQGLTEFHIAAHYGAEKIERYVADRPRDTMVGDLKIHVAAERMPSGTAGAFRHTAMHRRSIVGGAPWWLCVNGDTLCLSDLSNFINAVVDGGWAGGMLALRVPDGERYGCIKMDCDGALVGFGEKCASGPSSISAGCYLLSERIVDMLETRTPLSFEFDVFPKLIADGERVLVMEVDAPFIDIGTEASISKVDGFLAHYERWFPSMNVSRMEYERQGHP